MAEDSPLLQNDTPGSSVRAAKHSRLVAATTVFAVGALAVMALVHTPAGRFSALGGPHDVTVLGRPQQSCDFSENGLNCGAKYQFVDPTCVAGGGLGCVAHTGCRFCHVDGMERQDGIPICPPCVCDHWGATGCVGQASVAPASEAPVAPVETPATPDAEPAPAPALEWLLSQDGLFESCANRCAKAGKSCSNEAWPPLYSDFVTLVKNLNATAHICDEIKDFDDTRHCAGSMIVLANKCFFRGFQPASCDTEEDDHSDCRLVCPCV